MKLTTFRNRGKKVLFFDINGTLLDPKAAFRDAFQAVWDDMSGRWTATQKPDSQELLRAYEAAYSSKDPSAGKGKGSKEHRMRDSLIRAGEKEGISFTPALSTAFLRKVKLEALNRPKPYADAADTLQALAKHYTLAVISNGVKDKRLEQLTQAGLLEHLSQKHIFTSSEAGVRKPDPAIFRLAMKAMSITPAEALMIGDNWKKDVQGAAHAGLDAVWIARGTTRKNSRLSIGSSQVICVSSLRDLIPIC